MWLSPSRFLTTNRIEACLSSSASKTLTSCDFIPKGGSRRSTRFYRSPGAVYARLEKLQCHRLRPTGSSLRQVFGKRGLLPRLSGSSSTILTTVHVTVIYRLVNYETISFAGGEHYPTQLYLTLKAFRRYLYKLYLSRLDGKHNLSAQGP